MPSLFTAKQRALIPIAAFTASGDMDKLTTSLSQGLAAGLSINEIKEVLVQMYAYAGFPRSLNALGNFMTLLDARKAQGIEEIEGPIANTLPTDRSSFEFGAENQTQLVGQPVKGALFDFAPAIDAYLKAHLFGDIFGRGVLTWQDRELATIAGLANISGVNSQLKSHYGISLNNGITPAQLQEFVKILAEECGQSVADNAAEVLASLSN